RIDEWNRDSLKKLKDKLSKLVRPDLNKTIKDEKFNIKLIVPDEIENDQIESEKGKKKGESDGYFYYNSVNGDIRNFIFEELNIRTTKIQTQVVENGKYILTRLDDRDEFIYEIKENNRFTSLSDTSITLYFLN